jgi:hypothetical protein
LIGGFNFRHMQLLLNYSTLVRNGPAHAVNGIIGRLFNPIPDAATNSTALRI